MKKDHHADYHEYINNSVWLAEEQMRMASERTYLSWIRTGLTSVGLGIAIAKFLVFRKLVTETAGHWAGLLLIIWGIGIFIFALISYRNTYSKLHIFKANKHPLRPMIIITTILVVITLILLTLILD